MAVLNIFKYISDKIINRFIVINFELKSIDQILVQNLNLNLNRRNLFYFFF